MYINYQPTTNYNNINYTGRFSSWVKNAAVFRAFKKGSTEHSVGKFGTKIEFDDIPKYAIPKEEFDMSHPQIFRYPAGKKVKMYFCIDFDPNRVGKLYDKKKKEPVSVYIIKTYISAYPKNVSYYFLSKTLEECYGHVELSNDTRKNRLIVEWLENNKPNKIGGVGKLADRLASKYCAENNLPFNIESIAVTDSMMAHYKRGKRFVPPKKDRYEYAFLMHQYGTSDVNQVMENLLKESKQNGKKADLSCFNNYNFAMYLPKELAQKYAKESLMV